MKRIYYAVVLMMVLGLSACDSVPEARAPAPVAVSDSIVRNLRIASLGFPYQHPEQASFIHCFALCPWNQISKQELGKPSGTTFTKPFNKMHCDQEKHIGFDIYPKPYSALEHVTLPVSQASWEVALVPIVAPTDAIVEQLGEGGTEAGTKSRLVALRLNEYWYVIYSFEPHSLEDDILQLQKQNIFVEENDRVSRGQVIGNLVVTETTEVEPSLHYSFLYKVKSQSLDDLYTFLKEHIELANVSDGTDVAAAGSPWRERDLHIPTTFFCPEAFSSVDAKTEYANLPKLDRHGVACSSMCAYGSTNGDCGSARIP